MRSDRDRWDERHAAVMSADPSPRPPAGVLLEHAALIEGQPRGQALDVACGLGRNALFLARAGFTVDAVDVSPVALERLREAAGALPVRTHLADLKDDPLPGRGYVTVVNTYFLERRLFAAIAAALAPGGLLVFETFLPDPSATYGPQDPDRVLQPGELRAAFPGLEVLEYAEHRREPGSRPVATLVARA